jgi:hypothetical protein
MVLKLKMPLSKLHITSQLKSEENVVPMKENKRRMKFIA